MTFKGKALLWLRISEAQSVVSWVRQNIVAVCMEEDPIILWHTRVRDRLSDQV